MAKIEYFAWFEWKMSPICTVVSLVRDKSWLQYRIFFKYFGDHLWWKPALRQMPSKIPLVSSNHSASFHSQLFKHKGDSWAALLFEAPHGHMDLLEICHNATKGREFALLGNYDSSQVYYEGVLQQIHKHGQTLGDTAIKVKWQQVRPLWPSDRRIPKAVTPICLPASTPLCTRIRLSSSSSCVLFLPYCEQVRLALTEEYKQVKAIMTTLDSFKSGKPSSVLAPQPEEKQECPAVWPPPFPVEHRCVHVCVCDRVTETSSLVKHLFIITA